MSNRAELEHHRTLLGMKRQWVADRGADELIEAVESAYPSETSG